MIHLQAHHSRIHQRAHSRGLTLIEIMIVVAIIAMVSGGVAIVAVKQAAKARLAHAETTARTLRQAVQSYQVLEVTSDCPSLSELVDSGQIDEASKTRDPWGNDYLVACTQDRVVVASRGPDGTSNTEDDIRVPEGAAIGEDHP